MATWRKEPRTHASGTKTWRLARGRNEGRIRLNLGVVSEAEATRALARIQAEEDSDQVQRVLSLYERDEAAAVMYLVGDPAEETLFCEEINYGLMPLAEYQRTVYAPWRETDAKSWPAESGYWVRILRELGTLRLRDVDAHVVADYLDTLMVEREGARQGEPCSGNTKRLHRSAIQSLLNRAERLKHIEVAPDLSRFRLKGSTKLVQERADPLSLEELLALMEASKPRYRAMWAVGAGLGLRPSELMRVQWEDVHWTDRTIDIRGDDEGEGKTALSVDMIPLTPLAFDEIRTWWMRQGQPAKGAAFPSRTGEEYQAVSAYKRALATAARKAGIERAVTPYLLRHSFATIAWSLGIEQDVARRVMRHADLAMLDKVYCRPRPAELVAKVAAFARPKGEEPG